MVGTSSRAERTGRQFSEGIPRPGQPAVDRPERPMSSTGSLRRRPSWTRMGHVRATPPRRGFDNRHLVRIGGGRALRPIGRRCRDHQRAEHRSPDVMSPDAKIRNSLGALRSRPVRVTPFSSFQPRMDSLSPPELAKLALLPSNHGLWFHEDQLGCPVFPDP